MVYVTQHAKKRCKQRLGLPKSACQRHAQKVFDKGLSRTEVKGNLKIYLDYLFLSRRSLNQIKLYGEFIYLFNDESLVTVLHTPRKYL
jgi:hypothetical protein